MGILLEQAKRLLLIFNRLVQRLAAEINTPPKTLYPLDEDEMEELTQQERRAEWERQQRPKDKS